ncbi:MAG: hypothetical protein FWD34_10785 [Oscillospiraceae bacterium]|nr:hypothetical protein [Oscillospiraceae bacterium]
MRKVIAVVVVSVMLTACTGAGSEDVTETTVHVCEACERCLGEDEHDVTETVAASETTTVEVSEPVETTVPREVSPEELIEAFNDGVRAQEVAFRGAIAHLDKNIEEMKRLMVTEEEAELYLSGYDMESYAMRGYEWLLKDLAAWEASEQIIWEETEGWHDLTEDEQKLRKGWGFETVRNIGLEPGEPYYTYRDGYAGFTYKIGCEIVHTFWAGISLVRIEGEWKVYSIGYTR